VVQDWVPYEQLHWRTKRLGGFVTAIRYLEIEKHGRGELDLLERRAVHGAAGPLGQPRPSAVKLRRPSPGWARRCATTPSPLVAAPEHPHISGMIDDLYSARILTLVANMPRAGRLAAPDASAEKTAKLCGSRIVVDVSVEDGGRRLRPGRDGLRPGPGFGGDPRRPGGRRGSFRDRVGPRRLARYAQVERPRLPAGRFSELAVLEPVKDYPARHASTLLAFEAAVEAVRKATGGAQTRTSRAGAA
jgi:NifU-like protein involved in Fe-S cluster formation